MGGTLSQNNPLVVSAFRSALGHQTLVVLVLLLVAVAAWAVRATSGFAQPGSEDTPVLAEPAGRRLLRVSFGVIWIVDGILQTQAAMPIGMPTDVVQPTETGAPGWVQHLVNDGLAIWIRHPVPAATSAVWIQVGIGAALLLAPRGRLSRLAGLASVGWGLVVWVFGNSFGGIFGPGVTWLFGAPGAVLFYCIAGALVAAPDRAWIGPRLGRALLAVLGLFFVGMGVLQAWPGRGFWQGQANPRATAGGLTSMVQSMEGTSQPGWLTSLLRSFASFDAAHGWAVNLFVVVALVAIGLGFLSGRRSLTRAAVWFGIVLCLATWVLVQDLGFLGGVGTDPNSMIPMLLVFSGAYLAWVRDPLRVEAVGRVPAVASATGEEAPVRAPLFGPAAIRGAGVVTALGALGIMLIGAVPMAFASVNPHTDAIVTEGINGEPQTVASPSPAPGFDLVDQTGRPVTLASFRGRTVALTFLDPVCTTDCPLIAQTFRQVDDEIHDPRTTAFVAIVANPTYSGVEFVRAFDQQEHLTALANWYFLTGSVPELTATWKAYGIAVQSLPAGGMIAHSDNAFVIDASGHLRALFGSDPGDTTTTASSLGTLLRQQVQSAMHS